MCIIILGYQATEFYNASHIGSLTEELCEDEACNEIREEVEQPGNAVAEV